MNIRQLLSNYMPKNNLEQYVIDYLLDYSNDDEQIKLHIQDIFNYGCVNGTVSPLIYYYDTSKFFEDYKEEINELLSDTLDSCGMNGPKDLFNKRRDDDDPLALDVFNQNLLAWFGFEETLYRLENVISQ